MHSSRRCWSSSVASAAAASTKTGASSSRSRYPPLPPGWQAIIGIETHAQLCPDPLQASNDTPEGPSGSKLFSRARLVPSGGASGVGVVPPNTLVTPFDAAYPGTLPRRLRAVSKRSAGPKSDSKQAPEVALGAVHQALRTAIALQCQDIDSASTFDRKHYFYPDLPAGYQITQKYGPLAKQGSISLLFDDGHLPSKDDEINVGIECIQLEQDTAKSTHVVAENATSSAAEQTLIDLNRSGAGLMEIVSGPDIRTPEQAGAYIRKLQEILRAIGASDGNMDEGSLRCDVNVSVYRPDRDQGWGVRTEIKNLNSAKFVMQAISHETHRQVRLLEDAESGERGTSGRGSGLEQETRGFDEKTGTTFRLRSKEHAPEYRFMPDPNLGPLLLDEAFLNAVRTSVPELPDATRQRLIKTHALTVREANVLIRASSTVPPSSPDRRASEARPRTAVEYYEALAALVRPKVAINWTINELMKSLNANGLDFESCPLPPPRLAELLKLVEERTVTGTVAKTLLPELIVHPSLLKQSSLTSLLADRDQLAPPSTSPASSSSDPSATNLENDAGLTALCTSIIADFPTEARLIRAGKHKIVMKLVGELMKRSRGAADAVKGRETFVALLLSERKE